MTVYRTTAIQFVMSALLSLGSQTASAEPGHSIGLRHEHVRPESPIDDMPSLKLATPPTGAHGAQSGSGKVIVQDLHLRKPPIGPNHSTKLKAK